MCRAREHELQPSQQSIYVADVVVQEACRCALVCPVACGWHICLRNWNHLKIPAPAEAEDWFVPCVLTPVAALVTVLSAVGSSEERNGTSLLSLTEKGKGLAVQSLPLRRVYSWEKCSSLWKEERINPISLFVISFQLSFVTVQRAKTSQSCCSPQVTGMQPLRQKPPEHCSALYSRSPSVTGALNLFNSPLC